MIDLNQERMHPLTGKPLAPCPTCKRLSGLSGIDGRECLACSLLALKKV